MAIDTRAKRFSMMNLGRMPSVAQFEADGSIDADDRSHLLRLYGGIALDNPVAPTITLIAQARSIGRFVQTRIFGRVN